MTPVFLKAVKAQRADHMKCDQKPWKQELLFWALMLPALAALMVVCWAVLELLVKLPEWSVEYGFTAISIIAVAVSLARLLCPSNLNSSDALKREASGAWLIGTKGKEPGGDRNKE